MVATSDNGYQQTKDWDIRDLGGEFDVDSLIWADEIADETASCVEQLRSAATQAEEFVRARPWQAVGMIALVGFTAGLLLARMLSRPASA
jgi:DUF883 C-terminal glycine zipper region